MARFIKDRSKSKGAAPGSLVFIGHQRMEKPLLDVIQYDKDQFYEQKIETIKNAFEYTSKPGVTWINIFGLHDPAMMKEMGQLFGFHPIHLEDMMNTDQRPKYINDDDKQLFFLKMLYKNKENSQVSGEQICVVVNKEYVLCLQERTGDVFDPVRTRIKESKGRIRQSGTGYLAYALLDTIVDNYIQLIGNIGEQVENLEEPIIQNPTADLIKQINNSKMEISYLRKNIRPVKDMILLLLKSESDFSDKEALPYLNDLYDLVNQAMDTIDTYSNILSDYLNVYNASLSNKMNQVMKVLTVFAAIFIPLTFIAGVYGTNFDYIPELKWRYSYFIFWGVIVVMGVFMVIVFKRKKWL